jgi:hypothetical protein
VNRVRNITALAALSFGALMLGSQAAFAQAAPAAAPASGPESVRGGMFDASDPAALRRFMEEQGYRAELIKTGDGGDPVIKGRLSRSDYLIQFYECENGAFCNSVQFIVQADKPASLGLEQVNDFNARWRYARANVVGGTVRLQMDLNLDAGVTASNLEDTLDIWRQLVEFFERDMLGLGPRPS